MKTGKTKHPRSEVHIILDNSSRSICGVSITGEESGKVPTCPRCLSILGAINRDAKTARFEMRINPDKLAKYRKQADKERLSLSSWLERLADNKLAGAYDE